jgi:hypothetical protein
MLDRLKAKTKQVIESLKTSVKRITKRSVKEEEY